MKVAHLDTGREWRGGQAQVLFLMRGLRSLGDENLLLAPEGPLLERARSEGFAVERWRPRSEIDPFAVWRAKELLTRFRPSVAHAHSAHAHALGVPAASWAQVPAIVVSRRVDFSVATNPFSALKYRLPVDRYFCISHGVLEVMRRAGVPDEKLALVPSGIEFPNPARGEDLRRLIGAPDAAPIVGTVAALAPHKNHADLLAAIPGVLQRVPEAEFVWVGEGECRASLERERAQLGLEAKVHMLGFRRDAHALLSQFTVFALSSYLEGLCTSLLDAQALGVPIVATAVGGIPDVVQDGVNGRLVPGRDVAALSRALIEALTDPALRVRWAARARETVESFRIERTVGRSRAEYQRILDGKA
jgi:glycosyltransferase involved in cell wall biosynthesis